MTTRPESKTCSATCSDGSECNAWAVEGKDVCYHHGGASTGAPEGHTNSVSHGAYTDQSKLYSKVFSDRECDLADRIFQDYYETYQEKHGYEPPEGHRVRLFRIAVNAVTEMRVENWYSDKPEELETGTPHVNKEKHISEDGRVYYRYKKSPAIPAIKHLEGYNRKWLKQMDLLPSPESQKADAMSELQIDIQREKYDG